MIRPILVCPDDGQRLVPLVSDEPMEMPRMITSLVTAASTQEMKTMLHSVLWI